MNRIYFTIWNEVLGAWVAVSELDSARGKPKKSAVVAVVATALIGVQSLANAIVIPVTCRAPAADPFSQGGANSLVTGCGASDFSSPGATVIGAFSGAGGGGVAVGNGAGVVGKKPYRDIVAVGAHAMVGADLGVGVGSGVLVSSRRGIAIGDNALVGPGYDGSVAIGSGARVSGSGLRTAGPSPTGNDTTTIGSLQFGTYAAANSPGGVVSVGDTGQERLIQNVGAGLVSALSSDAINGSQLYAVASTMESSITGLSSATSSINTLSTSTSTGIHALSTGLSTTDSTVTALSTLASTGLSSATSSINTLSTSTSTGIHALSTGLSTTDSTVTALSTLASTGLSSATSSINTLSTSASTAIQAVNVKVRYFGVNDNSTQQGNYNNDATGVRSLAVGVGVSAAGASSVAVGDGSNAQSDGAVAIGQGALATGGKAVSIGWGNTASGNGAVAIGDPNVATGTGAVAMGADDTAIGTGAVALGNANTATGNSALALGTATQATANNTIALGHNAVASAAGAQAYGAGATATAADSVVIGANSNDGGRSNVVSVGSDTQQRQITNVAPGSQGTDAVNVNQLTQVVQTALSGQQAQINSLGLQLQQTDQMAKQGIAAVGAMASIPQLDRDANFGVGIGTSTFLGQKAMAVNMQARITENLKASINGGFSGGQKVIGAGMLYQWK